MANYAVTNSNAGTQQSLSSSYKSLIGVNAASATALRRIKVYDLLFGTTGTPADNYVTWDVSRMTAAGTGTSTTPTILDPADSAALTVATSNYTVEPTVTAASSLLNVGVNQRASYRWVAAPGSELVAPATNLAGFVVRALSGGYTGTASASMMFQEQ